MAKKKKGSNKPLPPCPDPERYTLVRSKEGDYWRLKRGFKKPARLNDAFSRNTENMKLANPVSGKLIRLLDPYLRGLKCGRLHARITGKLVKSINKNGRMDLSALNDFDFQEDYPLTSLLNTSFNINVDKNAISVHVHINRNPVRQHNNLVTDFYFDLILVSGDLQKLPGLRIENTTSNLYKINISSEKDHKDCIMSLSVAPKRAWILLFRVSCLEGNELADHARNYAMKVIRVSRI